ncbi:amyloid-beta A4 precursor protein-binding family A member 3 isoform X2 [Bufo gargarizans]|uniref:amyloid-beta A4 precursor protein-binding family A member 3 isoform X2 n=1 Tax=Bufo gargarizans TaxID=30331 RepID=UPI001CF54247|nr:amyloid-beta A4 precursor protein-binding family A member 3 isoform X2 [Bufo gargarizans]
MMETGMDFQKQTPSPPSYLSGNLLEAPHMDLETQELLTGTSHEECCGTASPGSVDIDSRAPPRVDSCPDMDTRPPLEVTGMESQLDPAGQGSAFHMQELLNELPTMTCPSNGDHYEGEAPHKCQPCLLHIAMGKGFAQRLQRLSESSTVPDGGNGLFLTDNGKDGMFTLFQCEEGTLSPGDARTPLARLEAISSNEQYSEAGGQEEEESSSLSSGLSREDSSCSLADQELQQSQRNVQETLPGSEDYPAPPKVPGPCEAEDLLDGVVFGAKYLGSTQLQCERHQTPSTRMRQAQEAVDRVKAPDGESQPMTEVDVMVSTQRVKVLTADTQEALMDHHLQTISYTADIGNIVVIMARRKSPRSQDQQSSHKRPHKMLCHVFQSVDAQLIAQAIGQAFGLAYQNFLRTESLEPDRHETTRVTEQLYNADLAHFTKEENIREVYIQKERGEMLGVAVVESGWGSLLPTVVIANLMHAGPAERSGELSIGDHVTSVNGTSLVGLPFSTSQGLIRDLKGQSEVVLSIVRCPPVVTAIIQRPDTTYQLGFSVEDGVICSLVRGGIAERGGIRVGHRIIEINGQSVVATAHEKIIQTLLDATGEPPPTDCSPDKRPQYTSEEQLHFYMYRLCLSYWKTVVFICQGYSSVHNHVVPFTF